MNKLEEENDGNGYKMINEDYRVRLIYEFEELSIKIDKINRYFMEDYYNEEKPKSKKYKQKYKLMEQQYNAMVKYQQALEKRILLEMGVDINE